MNLMKTGWLAGIMALCLVHVVQAEFTQPSDALVAAAAAEPAAHMVALLKDANADQAAEVVKLVVAKIVALGLSSDVQSVRITVAIGGSFAAISPSMHGDFASALGTAIAGSAVITAAPGVVSTIQNTIASTGGVQGGATLAQSFGTAYQAAGGGGLGGSGQPPPPLISDGYPGQTIP